MKLVKKRHSPMRISCIRLCLRCSLITRNSDHLKLAPGKFTVQLVGVQQFACVPMPVTLPVSRNTIRSASITVDKRWAMTSVVRPLINVSNASWTYFSELLSKLEVASSIIRIDGLRSSARAMPIRWRWPPESLMPRSPTSVL